MKHCLRCHAELRRARYANGRLEAPRDWDARKYCGLACSALAQRSETGWRARKRKRENAA